MHYPKILLKLILYRVSSNFPGDNLKGLRTKKKEKIMSHTKLNLTATGKLKCDNVGSVFSGDIMICDCDVGLNTIDVARIFSQEICMIANNYEAMLTILQKVSNWLSKGHNDVLFEEVEQVLSRNSLRKVNL